jgi:RRXRR protein/HNH endonuclease
VLCPQQARRTLARSTLQPRGCLTLKGLIALMLVYVQDQSGRPLMPTRRLGQVRRWLTSGRARVVRCTPFTIRLLDRDGGHTQPLQAGVDLGTAHVGVSVLSPKQELFAAEFRLRTDLSQLLTQRRQFRRARRHRKVRYRKPRFLNRKRKDPLAPSVRAKVEETLQVVRFVARLLPITGWTFEIGNFDPHRFAHPEVEGKGYQRGEQADFENVRAYVLWRDRHQCQGCHGGSGDPVLTVHHLRPRAEGGSDRPANLLTLCRTCHERHHQEQALDLKPPPSLRDPTQLNLIKVHVLRATVELPRSVTFGYLTKVRRRELWLSKSHVNDAFVIAGGESHARARMRYLGVFARRQNRKLTRGKRSQQRNTVSRVNGYRRGDRVRLADGREGFVSGLRSSGYFDVRRLDGTVISHSLGYRALLRLEGARTLRLEARMPMVQGEGSASSPRLNAGVSALSRNDEPTGTL